MNIPRLRYGLCWRCFFTPTNACWNVNRGATFRAYSARSQTGCRSRHGQKNVATFDPDFLAAVLRNFLKCINLKKSLPKAT